MRFWSPLVLRNGVNNWKEVTPEPLQKAVEALRRKFAENAWKAGEIMRTGCHPALHRGMADQARTISDGIKKLGYPALLTVDEGQIEPKVFAECFDLCAKLLANDVRKTFSDLFDIGSARSALLRSDPVDWASLQTRVLVADESHRIPIWTKNACDKQPYDPSVGPIEAMKWTKWRAPKWFFMQPFANWPFDSATAWERMDEAKSKELLEVVEDKFNQRLIMALERAVDETHVQLAKRGNRAELRQDPPESSPRRHLARAPKPLTTLSGTGGGTVPSTKPTEIPHNPPSYFPSDLWPQTYVILLEGQRKFPLRMQTLELCKRITSEMTPLFCEAVKAGKIKASAVLHEGLGGMEDLLRFLLVQNDDGPKSGFSSLSDQAYRLGQKIRQSDEWLALAKAITNAQAANITRADRPRTGDEQAESSHAKNSANSAPDAGSKSTNETMEVSDPVAFTHSPDYRSVTLRGKNYPLTSQQAQMIQILHQAHESGNPDVSVAHILERLEKQSSRWQDTFKSNPNAKRALVKSGERRGTLRMNV